MSASAVMTMGAVAMASGLLPGPDYTLSGGTESTGRVQADATPEQQTPAAPAQTPGGPGPEASAPADRPSDESRVPSSAPSQRTPKSSAAPSERPSAPREEEKETGKSPSGTPSSGSERSASPPASTSGPEAEAEAAVLSLVNRERAQAGCEPVTEDPELAQLAQSFSEDMAEQGFFDHVAPDGSSPWDRAQAVGVTDLAAENIARGQADAESAVQAWMDSPGHRANILNCDFKTMGVGAQFGGGEGPWWTQNFGY